MHTGKTTVLVGLLRWLRGYLEKPEEDVLDFISWAMYNGPIEGTTPPYVRLVREFLGALRSVAGPQYHQLAILRQATYSCIRLAMNHWRQAVDLGCGVHAPDCIFVVCEAHVPQNSNIARY